eukprot:gene11611-13555_t
MSMLVHYLLQLHMQVILAQNALPILPLNDKTDALSQNIRKTFALSSWADSILNVNKPANGHFIGVPSSSTPSTSPISSQTMSFYKGQDLTMSGQVNQSLLEETPPLAHLNNNPYGLAIRKPQQSRDSETIIQIPNRDEEEDKYNKKSFSLKGQTIPTSIICALAKALREEQMKFEISLEIVAPLSTVDDHDRLFVDIVLTSSMIVGGQRRWMSTASDKVVGFIGLGNMGGHQAANLIKKGHKVVVYDISADNVARLKEKGASVAASPAELASQADVIITMLPASAHVKSVYCGDNGIFKTIKPGTLLLDSSTIDPQTARDVATIATTHKATLLDCPVSGGTGGAEAGTLTFMVGGEEADFERARPYLSAMGKNLVHCGAVGTGQAAKVCNNLVLGISMIAVSEAMNLGVKLGIEPSKLSGIFNTSSARCWSSELYNPCPGVIPTAPASRGYTGGFGSALMNKDLGLAVDSAKAIGEPLPLGSAAHQLYTMMVARGFGAKDFSVVYEFLQKEQPKN